MKREKTVEDYISNADRWRDELKRLREILLSSDLVEEIKWGSPCYTYRGKNVVGLAGFKSYFGLWFHQGALLADEKNVLINAQEGTTKALRQWRMKNAADIKPGIIKSYVKEAIQLVKDGRSITPERKSSLVIPPELKTALQNNARAKKAFAGLRPGLQREYAEYVAAAKQDATKKRRIEKILPMITSGGGLNDKYR